MTAGVTTALLHALTAPAHLERLRSVPEKDFVPAPELERWTRGIPASEQREALDLWERLRAELSSGQASAERAATFCLLSLQVGGELESADRFRLFVRAAEATPHGAHQSALAASAAAAAVRTGDLTNARTWLAKCHVTGDSLIADSTQRIAAALLAASEGQPEIALTLLGRTDGEVPVLASYRPLAMAIRAQALELTGARPGAKVEFERLVAERGRKQALAIFQRLPEHWHVDTSSWDDEPRSTEAFHGDLLLAGAVLVLGAATLLGWEADRSIATGQPHETAWFTLLGVVPFLLSLAAWLAFSGVRRRRIAKGGLGGRGTIVGKVPRRLSSRDRPRYGLSVEAILRDSAGKEWPVLATSLTSYGPNAAAESIGKTVRVLWHPAHAAVAILID
jgi:hypothetical protein